MSYTPAVFTPILSYQELNDNTAVILTDVSSTYNLYNTSLNEVKGSDGATLANNAIYQISAHNTYDFTAIGAADNTVGHRFVTKETGGPLTFAGTSTDKVVSITPAITELVAVYLDTVATFPNGTLSTKNRVDLLSNFGPFTTISNMVYTITPALLGDGTGSLIEDGISEYTYTLVYDMANSVIRSTGVSTVVADYYYYVNSGSITYNGTNYATGKVFQAVTGITTTYGTGKFRLCGSTSSVTSALIFGKVKKVVYDMLRKLPYTYMFDNYKSKQLLDACFANSYLDAMIASAFISKTQDLLTMLGTLQNITSNGTTYNW